MISAKYTHYFMVGQNLAQSPSGFPCSLHVTVCNLIVIAFKRFFCYLILQGMGCPLKAYNHNLIVVFLGIMSSNLNL